MSWLSGADDSAIVCCKCCCMIRMKLRSL